MPPFSVTRDFEKEPSVSSVTFLGHHPVVGAGTAIVTALGLWMSRLFPWRPCHGGTCSSAVCFASPFWGGFALAPCGCAGCVCGCGWVGAGVGAWVRVPAGLCCRLES